jgi:predicted transcriptional regulator
MLMTIKLPEDLHEKLRSWAQAANLSEEQVICDALEAYLAVPCPLREAMDAWQAAGGEAIEKVAPIAGEVWR